MGTFFTYDKASWKKTNEDDIIRKTSTVLENINFYLTLLQSSQAMFDKFKAVVEKDLIVKIVDLETRRLNVYLDLNEKTLLNAQIMIMKCYLSRVKIFQKVSDKSILNICKEYSKYEKDDEKIGKIVRRHVEVLVKMKRRMKAILDITEKYAVIDSSDKSSKSFSAKSYNLDPSTRVKNKTDYNQQATTITNYKYFEFDSPSFSRVPFASTSTPLTGLATNKKHQFDNIPNRPLKFMSDHIAVLVKTFTNKT